MLTRSGHPLTIEKRLGEGGQGKVYLARLQGRPVCVKVITHQPERMAAQLERVLERAGSLRHTLLVLPEELLAGPEVGYVMPYVADAAPLDHFLLRYRRLVDSYRSVGLGARLEVCYQLATALQAVHRAGLAYLDLNGGNLLLGARSALIDTDNLIVCGTEHASVLGRPWYMAPEVARGQASPDPTTDLHSLAVICFLLLLMRHPLIGDEARQGSPDEETRRLRNGPYVHDPHDRSNRSEGYRLPLEMLTPRLQRLFAATFCEGLARPGARTPASQWRDAFSRAREALLTCPHCKHETFFSRELFDRPRCAWPHCGRPLPRVPTLIVGPEKRVVPVREGLQLYRHHFDQPFNFERPLLQVGHGASGWFVERLSEETYLVAEDTARGQARPLAAGERGVRLRDDLCLRVGLSGAPVVCALERWPERL